MWEGRWKSIYHLKPNCLADCIPLLLYTTNPVQFWHPNLNNSHGFDHSILLLHSIENTEEWLALLHVEATIHEHDATFLCKTKLHATSNVWV